MVSHLTAENDSRQSHREQRWNSMRAPILRRPLRWQRRRDVAIVFAYQWESEGMDLDSLSLPDHQDDLIAAVAAANPAHDRRA